MDPRDRLKEIIKRQSFKYSQKPVFSLVSGTLSSFYFDCKKTTMDPEGAALIGELIWQTIKPWKVSGIGGLTLGADPIAAAVMHVAWQEGQRINQFVVRKGLKDHGEVKWIEGNVFPGDRVIVVDDVVTTGGSTIKAIEQARKNELQISGVVVLIDRQEFQGIENIKGQVDCPVVSLFCKEEFLDEAQYTRTQESSHEKPDFAQVT